MHIALREQAFLPLEELAAYQAQLAQRIPGQYGAAAIFIGVMRDFNDGENVQHMTLEHYPGMTERELQRIADSAAAQWSLLDILLIHRVGELAPNDPIVLIAVWSAHRAEAFSACRFLLEALKSKVPLWKRETVENTARWVAHNTPASI